MTTKAHLVADDDRPIEVREVLDLTSGVVVGYEAVACTPQAAEPAPT